MALFEFPSNKANITTEEASSTSSEGPSLFFKGQSLKQLRKVIGELQQDQHIHFQTSGSWSMHNLMEYILRKIGKADVYFTTYSITEETLRNVHKLIDEDLINSIHALFDYRIEKRKAESFQFASRIMNDYCLVKCHAKVMVIANDDWKVSIVGSANMTTNTKLEAGVICTDKSVAHFHKNWIMEKFDGRV
jgi:hypothetical protein